MVSLSLILENEEIAPSYKKLFEKQNFRINNCILIQNVETHIADSLIVIDISSHSSVELLKNFVFPIESMIIFISPFSAKYFKVPNNIKNIKHFFIIKPADSQKLSLLIEECYDQLERNSFLKHKQNALIHSVDDAPFRIALYNIDGSLSYANAPYIQANQIKDIENATFDSIVHCKIEFKDILYNLKIKQVFMQEKQENDKWYKSYFYMTEHNSVVVHFCLDQTQEKLYLQSLKRSAEFFEQSLEAVMITDSKGNISQVNDSFCKITGYTKEEAIGQNVNILKSGQHPNEFYDEMWNSLTHRNVWQGEIWNKRKNGEVYPEWLSITKLKEQQSEETNYIGIFTDISSLKETNKKLKFYANHDHLTGLFNKAQFELMLNQTIETSVRNKRQFALLFVDLDYFKDVNDTAGHHVGDLVLKETATRLRQNLRKDDILSRIGGDEFTIIVNDVQEDSDVVLLANKLNESIKKVFVVDGKSFYLSLSVGIALFPYHGLNVNELSKNADSAMYEVKRNGRDGVMLYNKKFTDTLMKKVSLLNDLKLATKNKEFEVYYQLVVNLQTNKVIGAEALIRWKHFQQGYIAPSEFIPLAEHHGLIGEIGRFVLQTICEDLPSFLKKFGNDFVVAFNVSAQEFMNESFVNELLTKQKDFGIAAKNLEIEITETTLMQDHSIAIAQMKKMRDFGFTIAVDDFGTGYSSLNYLKKFPINKIKIDKSFIDDISDDQDDQDMVRAIVNIANIFKLEVQVEGVESKQSLNILKGMDISIIQGYLFFKPMPLHDLLNSECKIKK